MGGSVGSHDGGCPDELNCVRDVAVGWVGRASRARLCHRPIAATRSIVIVAGHQKAASASLRFHMTCDRNILTNAQLFRGPAGVCALFGLPASEG